MMDFLASLNTEVFWVGASVIVLFALIAKPVGQKIGAALDKRALHIKEDLDTAERLRDEAKEVLVLYQRKLQHALEEAESIIESARKEADRMVEDARKSIEKTMDKRIQLATEKIAMSERAVLHEVKEYAIEVAMLAARAVIKEQSQLGGDKPLLDSAKMDIERKLH